MAVPDFQSLMRPLLQLASDGAEHVLRDATEHLADAFALTPEDRSELLPSGRQRKLVNRMAWASIHLRRAGLLSSPGRGRFTITERGREMLVEHPERVDMKVLRQFPEYLDFTAGTALATKPTQRDEPATPEEILEDTYQGIRKTLAEELLERVRTAPPAFFERLVVELLVKMGYGGSRAAAGRAVGQSGDGGIDGVINEDTLGLDVVYIQAKRWSNTVGRPDVQMFAGSLDGQRATKGVYLTTSSFSMDAHKYAGGISKKIVLIDGLQLAELMIDHGVGVTPVATYELKRIDFDYFEAG